MGYQEPTPFLVRGEPLGRHSPDEVRRQRRGCLRRIGMVDSEKAIPEAFGNQPITTGGAEVSAAPTHRPDVFWDDTANTLYILMSGAATTTLYVYTYDDGTDTYTFSHSSDVPDFEASNSRAAIFKDSNGDLWASKMDGGGLDVSRSGDNGVSWLTPVTLTLPVDEGQTAITEVGGTLAVAAAENGDGLDVAEAGRFSKYLFYTLPLAQAANFANVIYGTGTLTFTGVVTPGETVTIGSRTYQFVATMVGAVENDVLIGGNARANLALAINHEGTPGLQYHADTEAHPDVFAEDTGTLLLTAKASGTEGNVATTETMVNGAFGAATLTGGASTWTRENVPLAQIGVDPDQRGRVSR